MLIEIVTPMGQKKRLALSKFSALEGLDIQYRFADFVASEDKNARRAYTFEILSYAKVIINDRELPLSTDALIDNHLCSWENVKIVFESVLRYNDIEPTTHAKKPCYWAVSGADLAAGFIGDVIKSMEFGQ